MVSSSDFSERLERLRKHAEPDLGTFGDWTPEPPDRPGRWSVPLPAALAGVLLVVVVVAVAAMVLLRPSAAPSAEVLPTFTTPMGAGGGSPSAAPAPAAPSASPAAAGARVYVVGQVREPGVVTLPAGARVEDAVKAAGGATGKADLTVINLARPVQDGEQIVVPKPGESVTPEPVSAPSGSATPGPVNLNTATAADLDALPGVGPVIAQRIVDWRQQNGGFTSVDDLGEVSGIGDATLQKLRPLVTT